MSVVRFAFDDSRSRFPVLLLGVCTAIAMSTCLWAGDWPTFRGPQRTGVSTETGLLHEWPKDGPKLVWKANGVGRGYSSLAILNGRIYTLGDGTSADDKEEYLLAYDQKTGDFVWKAKTGSPWNSGAIPNGRVPAALRRRTVTAFM